MSKTLLILRHAKSSWTARNRADHDRPLNGRGKRAAPRMGRLLREKRLLPDLIITSTARRARDTAHLAAEAAGYQGVIEERDSFYLASPQSYLERLRALPPEVESVLVVGHNPGLEELIAVLTGAKERLPTAALAQVVLPLASWDHLASTGEGELRRLWRPKELD